MPIQHGRLQLSRLGRHEVAVKNDQPAFKIQSCCKPDKISQIFTSFDTQKVELLSSIGFEGLLALQRHQALDGTLSLWLLQRFDPETMTLCLDGGVSLPIRDVDVYLVLGVPFEGKKVQYNYQLSRDVVNDARVALTVDNKPPSFTFKWLEEILVKDYGNHMTDQQKTAFKLAVVLYSMACFFAPLHSESSFPMALLNNFVDVRIKSYNWAEFILLTLGHAAKHVQSEICEGNESLMLFGCTYLLQVFYLDNINTGSLSTVHISLPRVTSFDPLSISMLTVCDSAGPNDKNMMQYGRSKLKDNMDVCYSRGWRQHQAIQSGSEQFYGRNFDKCWELFQDGLRLFDQCAAHIRVVDETSRTSIPCLMRNTLEPLDSLRTMLSDTLTKICRTVADDIKKTNLAKYPNHIPPVNITTTKKRKRTDTKSKPSSSYSRTDSKFARVAELSKTSPDGNLCIPLLTMRAMAYAHHPNTSVIVGTEHTQDGNIPASSGETSKPKINVKVPKTLSEFPLSPFELGLDHAGVPRMKRAIVYDWLNQNDFPGSHLERYWINHTVPWPICITGHVARACLLQSGNFTVEFCDFVMRLWSHMDDVIYKHAEQYGEAHKRWRHFLAASFAQSVTSQEDYLSCPRTRSMFIGDHINYKIEDCQMIILPVMSHGKWSCYFWDFKYKTATVVDPTLMQSNSVKVKSHHQDTLADLHKALFECIEHFLTEWDVDENDWEFSFPVDSGPRARAFNSGLYAVHYARAFDGQRVHFDLKATNERNLVDPRAEILYHIFMMPTNPGFKPQDLYKALGIL